MEPVIHIKNFQELASHLQEVNHKHFTDGEGYRKLKTRIEIFGQPFQETVTVGQPINNVIFLQNRSINQLLEDVEKAIQKGEITEFDGKTIELDYADEVDPADMV